MSDLNAMVENLTNMIENVADAVERTMRLEATRIQADAKRLAPVDTGQLRNSITTETHRDVDRSIVSTVGTNVAHGLYTELGTGPVGAASPKALPPGAKITYRQNGWTYYDEKTGKLVHTRGQPARPFLYPAFKFNEKRVRENVAKAIKKALKEGVNNG